MRQTNHLVVSNSLKPICGRVFAGLRSADAMGTATLAEFIGLLERNGELARVKTRVSPILEIAQICNRVCKTKAPHGHNELDRTIPGTLGGKALLFEDVEGSEIPVAINTFGSYYRMNLALG